MDNKKSILVNDCRNNSNNSIKENQKIYTIQKRYSMRKKKYQLNHSLASNPNSSLNQDNTPSNLLQTITQTKTIHQSHIRYVSPVRLLRKNVHRLEPAPSPHTAVRMALEPVQFPQELIINHLNQPTFFLKMTALFKVLYKTQAYRIISIFIHILYIFAVLIELPDQVCASDIHEKLRCNLSYYIQVICLAIIVPLCIVKKLRLVGLDLFRLGVEIVSFVSGILALTGPGLILKYAKALRCLRLLLLVRETNLIVPSHNMLTSLKSMKKVLWPAILIIYIYAIIGLYSFSDNEYSRCRDPKVLEMQGDWTLYEEANYLCGQRSCPIQNGVEYQCLNPIDFRVKPKQEQFSGIEFGSGLLKYSNILMAFMNTYKQTLITGSSRVILLQKQTMNFTFVLTYYYSFIYLLSYIYLNIFYGLMIVNRQNHISTKEEYEALTDKQHEYEVSEVERELIDKYQRVLKKITKNILFSTSAPTNKKPPIYETAQNLSNSSLLPAKRSGIKLDLLAVNDAITQHEVKKQIIKIVERKIDREETKEQKISQGAKMMSILKQTYYYFNITVVILGCVNVCMEHAGQSMEWDRVTNKLDLVFFGFYCLDFLGRYFLIVSNTNKNGGQLVVKIPQNVYIDGLILSICVTGYLYEVLSSDDFSDLYFTQTKIQKCFRAMIYLRILVILSFEPFFAESRKFFQFAWEAVKKSANFMLLWLLVLIMFSLMGYFLFGNCNSDQGCYPNNRAQISYHGVFEAIITTAVIMYNEDWDYIMYEHFPQHGYFIVVWNLIIITFGVLIISKYFMTFLLSELDTRINDNFDKENQQKAQQKSFLQNLIRQAIDESKSVDTDLTIESYKISQIQSKNLNRTKEENDSRNHLQQSQGQNLDQTKERNHSRNRVKIGQKNQLQKRVTFNSVTPEESGTEMDQSKLNRKKIHFRRQKNSKINNNSLTISQSQNSPQNNFKYTTFQDNEVIQKIEFCQLEPKPLKIHSPLKDKSLQTSKQPQKVESFGSFYPQSRVYMIVKSLAITTLVLNFMFYQPQSDPNQPFRKFLYYSSVIVDCFFIIDMVGQLYVNGLIKFFRKSSVSRWIDLILNIISIIYFTPLGSNYIVKRFYSFRCLRISYWVNLRCQNSQSMRVTVKGFIQLVPKILNLLLVICIIYGFFANIIIRIYKDEMWECVNYHTTQQINTKIDCLNYGGDWVEEIMNASNFGNALLYIFLISSTEDWLNTMNYISTIQGRDLQPQSSSSSFLRIFFLIFMFFANIIVINIFVGVCINNFKQIKKKVTGEANLSKDEKEWMNIKKQIYLLEPQPMDQEPTNQFRRFFFRITKSKKIKVFKFIQLIGLLVLLSFVTTNMSGQDKKKILLGQYIFILCGLITFFIELIANGLKNHNRAIRIFQFSLCVYALFYGITLMMTDLPNSVQKIFGGILVALQLGRYFLFIQQFEFFQKMFNSFITILPKTKDIFMLMIVTLFIYTCIGMEIFGYLKPGQQLNRFDQNYAKFGNAFFSLIKFSTWEQPINQIKDGIQIMTPNSVCFEVNDYASFTSYGQNGCGNTALALTFFITFHIIYSLILMPTLMGIIFDSYNEVYIDESACINKFQLRKVKEQWKKFDPQGTGYISYRDFWVLTSQIINIYNLAHNKLLNNETRQQFLKELNVCIYESPEGILCFQFHELIEALTRIILVRKEKSMKRKEIFNTKVTYIHEANKKSEILHKLKKSHYDSSHVLTLILLKSGLKSWKNKSTGESKGSLFQTIEMKNNIKRFQGLGSS